MWWNQYVGVPYLHKGRTREGLDCWGLVRLVYAEQFAIAIPSYVDDYEPEQYTDIAQLISERKDAWEKTDYPKVGDVVLFRIVGVLCHVGIYIGDKKFLHVREGGSCTIEYLDGVRWSSRTEGIYTYRPQHDLIQFHAAPHPLKTQRIDGVVPDNLTIAQIVDSIPGISTVPHDGVVFVDGILIPKGQWTDLVPAKGSRIEYRAVARGEFFRILAMIFLVVVSIWFPPALGLTGAWAAAAGAAIMVAGNLLINAIFPVRPPALNDPGTAASQNILYGGTNQANFYGAIPVVLGRHRVTAPLGAQIYSETDSTKSYLRELLVWGYGPVQVSDIRVGDTLIDEMEEVEYETVDGYGTDDYTRFNSLYGGDVCQANLNTQLSGSDQTPASPWISQVPQDTVSRIQVCLHFPQGMRLVQTSGEKAGKVWQNAFRASIQVRPLDPVTLSPTGSWGNIEQVFQSQKFNLTSAWFNIDNDQQLESVYRWASVSVDSTNNIRIRYGSFTTNPNNAPTGDLATRQAAFVFPFGTSTPPLYATIASSEIPLWRICIYGDSVYSTTDLRPGTVTGAALTYSGRVFTIASATITRTASETINIGAVDEDYACRKDAFTLNKNFYLPLGRYEVRVRQTSASDVDVVQDGNDFQRMAACYLVSITGYNNSRPVTPPKPLAMTAARFKATNQVNNTVDGISGTVHSVFKDYNSATSSWVVRPTRNPASIFRGILQHPANAQAVADSQIDLTALESWHTFCRTNSFMFDMVVTDQRSLLDVLRDVCAAGRASPTLRDGKWTIVVDRVRSTVAQLFTTHNSWGFESTKALPKMPHAFRVQFNNSEKGYQPDERIVYNDGYDATNATLFEGLTLPGVTTASAIHKHARFHFAQIKLRPETYTLNADLEHLICTRGDLVKVQHDVPMWGLGSGRIKNRLSSTQIELDEPVAMAAGTQYTIRIRLNDSTNITRTVAVKTLDGIYSVIDLTTSVTLLEAETGLLFIFGTLSSESVDLIVTGIEPVPNGSARITLTDYSPAVYDSDSEAIPAFNSKITKPPKLLQQTITAVPNIQSIISDERVMLRLAPGKYSYAIKLSFTSPSNLPDTVRYVEAEIDDTTSTAEDWMKQIISINESSFTFGEVQEGSSYKIRLRYCTDLGRSGPWVYSSNHTVVGKTNPPSAPTNLVSSISNQALQLDWSDAPEPDVIGYEVRLADSGWGNPGSIFRGDVSRCDVIPAAVGVARTWYVKTFDAANLYSATAASISYTVAAPTDVGSITETFADTSTTNASVTLTWPAVAPAFGLDTYVVSYNSEVIQARSTTITLPANWLGNRSFTVKVKDLLGNLSAGFSKIITKLAPNSVSNFRAQVIDNNVLLYWTLPAKTTLPIDGALIKRGATWATATEIGTKTGSFTTILETAAGTYTYWIAVTDTDANLSTPVSVTVAVSAPPDFVFNGAFNSAFAGTLSSAIADQSGFLVLPVNTTETWASHFTSRSWTAPSDQVTAGYPVFIQPAAGSGYYEETFDFGAILASSKVTVNYSGATIAGSPAISVTTSLSSNGSTWTDYIGATEVYGSNFRYVKVRVTVTAAVATALYQLNTLAVRADAKQKTDAGSVSALSTDASGTIVNFAVEFIDAISINLTPAGTTSCSAVYDFLDSIITGTYSVTTNVATINATAHGLIAGQKVKLTFSSGTAPSGTYTIASVVNANSYTVAITTANTSGNVSTYPESFRVYLFNSSGTRISGSVSWAVRGY